MRVQSSSHRLPQVDSPLLWSKVKRCTNGVEGWLALLRQQLLALHNKGGGMSRCQAPGAAIVCCPATLAGCSCPGEERVDIAALPDNSDPGHKAARHAVQLPP